MPPHPPTQLRTERLLLRCWRAEDAAELALVLAANTARLGAWIPRQVAEAAPVPELARRLAGFADRFHADIEWRYGLFSPDEQLMLGEASLFPRSADGRVPLASADRVEIGYWLREDATGQGFATEAARALVAEASMLPGVQHVEIRCDARNERSAAVPRRLGFRLVAPEGDPAAARADAPPRDMLWTHELPRVTVPDG